MCGIAGFCGFKADYTKEDIKWKNVLIDMRKSVAHRGRDACGEYLSTNCGLSHARLTIRDLTTGNQPIVRNIGGKKYVIVYNGEIYNSDDIKKELMKKGYVFETTTDTEVVLYTFAEYGENGVNLLNGIFAYAIWCEDDKKLWLYRDRFGIKPLFYTINAGTLVFGSEIKALFRYPDVTPSIDDISLCEVLGIGPARTEGNGVFKNINEVKYGSYVVFSENGFEENRYWQIESREHSDSYEKTVEKVNYLVTSAIEMQMVSDVPVCSFLSGGVDSCIVTAVAHNFLKKQGKGLNTFSFDFTDNDKNFKANSFQPEQDRPYVDIMLKNFDVNHTYLECSDEVLYCYLLKSVDAKDLPGMADVDASLLYFCSLVKNHNKVTLTGECADEIFGGYPWFHREEFLNSGTFPWSVNLDYRLGFIKKSLAEKLKIKEYVAERYRQSVAEVPHLSGESGVEKNRRIISYLNLKWFMTTLLDRMDRSSMYNALEARVPFADHRIVEYVYNVPWNYKCHNGVVKGLLRDSAKGLLPDEILYRKKSPYPKTYSPVYEKILAKNVMKILEDKKSAVNDIFERDKIIELINQPKDYGKPWFGQLMGGVQMLAYIVQIDYWTKKFDITL